MTARRPTGSENRRGFIRAASAVVGGGVASALLTGSNAHAEPSGSNVPPGYPYWVGLPGSGAPYVVDPAVGAQDAINRALSDVGRGVVFVAGGRYPIKGPIHLRTGQTLCGAGPHGTVLDGSAAGRVREPMISNRDPNSTRIVIRDIGLECAGRFDYGIRLLQGSRPEEWGPDPNHLLHRVYVYSPAVDGIYLGTAGYPGGVRETKINDCRVTDAAQVSYRIEGASDTTVVQSVSQAGRIGFLVAGGNSKLSMCKAFFTKGPGFRITSSRPTITGCESQDAQRGCGFELIGVTNGTLSGCTADSNGDDRSDRTSAGFYLENVQAVRLSGATYQRPDGAGKQRWGVYFGADVDRVLVSMVTDSSVGRPYRGAVLGSAGPRSKVEIIG
ncbi:right-handed parallel beta-helix repeat-containing protein [Thermasporomyces composti]|jgi:hypothetical protein|uniref:Parallel beta helix pectate lyase-like protein n=1 Tax=Thermasporomyces composti TaxID=696763 RepID=A0A3D9V6V8_THECX|nr:right-handed parallel beta-helix repeat-containing protein [Thermasporomyces composti]REF37247.1 parallel beta helix pectate lyase-like protein [Thermasporomyces composti]